MADRAREKEIQHRSHDIIRLYCLFRFKANKAASFLMATEASSPIPSQDEKISGVHLPHPFTLLSFLSRCELQTETLQTPGPIASHMRIENPCAQKCVFAVCPEATYSEDSMSITLSVSAFVMEGLACQGLLQNWFHLHIVICTSLKHFASRSVTSCRM